MPFDGEVAKFEPTLAPTMGARSPPELTTEERQALINARKLIEAGWVQHRGIKTSFVTEPVFLFGVIPTGLVRTVVKESFCIMGAMSQAGPSHYSAAEKLHLHLQRTGVADGIVVFNDAPGRKKEEVLALFDEVLA